jgi:RNA polymerase sigma-70 factor (ECF subfamily)
MDSPSLVSNSKDNDIPYGKTLVDTYQVKVYNICFSFLHNKFDAEDLTQDVFIDVLSKLHTFRGEAHLGTWIYRIAVNKSLNFLRSKKRRRWLSYLDEVLSISEDDKEPASNYETMEVKENAQIIKRAIDALTEKQRIAFTLNKINELTYKEVAETMNVSHSAVETYIHRARLNLRKALRKHFSELVQ